MCDDEINPWIPQDPTLSRRAFGLGAAATVGLTAAQSHAQAGVTMKDFEIKTPDGVSEAALFYPAGKGPWPGVLIWTDIGGLRPVFRDMGRRLAAQGYAVLVPNPFYRSAKAAETRRRSPAVTFSAGLLALPGPISSARSITPEEIRSSASRPSSASRAMRPSVYSK